MSGINKNFGNMPRSFLVKKKMHLDECLRQQEDSHEHLAGACKFYQTGLL